MHKSILATALTLLAGSAGLAAAAPSTYAVDPTHTFARYAIPHFGTSTNRGLVGRTSGSVVLDKAAQSFGATNLKKFEKLRDELKKGDVNGLKKELGDLRDALRKLAALPDDLAIYPGHGEPSTIGREKRENYFLQFR